MPIDRHRWGVVVVGARAAGSATALLLARLGHDVLLLDRAVFRADTLSTHQIARTGVTVTGLHHDDTGRVTGVHGHDRAGAVLDVQARFVIGADGLESRVAGAVEAEVTSYRGDGGAVQYAYCGGIASPGIELIAADRALTGVFPTHHGEACIWICSPSTDAHQARRRASSREDAFTAYLDRTAPELAQRLRSAHRTSPVRGMLRTPNYVRTAHGPGWTLVGDAGYHRDAVTGYGLSDAYRDAELLAVGSTGHCGAR